MDVNEERAEAAPNDAWTRVSLVMASLVQALIWLVSFFYRFNVNVLIPLVIGVYMYLYDLFDQNTDLLVCIAPDADFAHALADRDARSRHKMQWWTQYWKDTREKFHLFYTQTVYTPYYTYDATEMPGPFDFVRAFRAAYMDAIAQKLVHINEWIRRRFDAIWADHAHAKANIGVAEAEQGVRNQLAEEILVEIARDMSVLLAGHVWTIIRYPRYLNRKHTIKLNKEEVSSICLD